MMDFSVVIRFARIVVGREHAVFGHEDEILRLLLVLNLERAEPHIE